MSQTGDSSRSGSILLEVLARGGIMFPGRFQCLSLELPWLASIDESRMKRVEVRQEVLARGEKRRDAAIA